MTVSYRNVASCFIVGLVSNIAPMAFADNLFQNNKWSGIAVDRKASQIGDVISVIVFQNSESRNSTENSSDKNTRLNGDINTSGVSQFGNITFGTGYSGRGDIRRRESLVTQISVLIDDIYRNGDYQISGRQIMRVNGEQTTIVIRGRIRPEDITNDNQILSTKIANAEIDYDGSGFVSRAAKPGILNWLFSIFGLV